MHYHFHGSTMYKRRLYDVDGKVMRDDQGIPMTLYHPGFKSALEENRIRLIHCIHPGYRYFIQSEKQMQRFQQERREGAPVHNRYYHVYNDEDMTEHPNKRRRTYCILPKA